jgi:hypothetical protein
VAEVAAVVLLSVVGSLIGAATPWLALAPILAMALPLLAATAFLHRTGTSWRDLGFLRPMPFGRLLGLALAATASVILVTSFVVTPLLRALGAPPVDPTLLVDAIEGNTAVYLMFLIPVTWGSAAFGEELLARGFLLQRFELLTRSTAGAVFLQALLFALGHGYQGITGVLSLFVVGLILGYFYLRAGRNLWPVIVAHGLIDTISITLVYLGYGQPAPTGG